LFELLSGALSRAEKNRYAFSRLLAGEWVRIIQITVAPNDNELSH
jgi:hypothetical protein